MLSERQRADLRAKVDAGLVDPREIDFKVTKKSIVAYCSVCRRQGAWACKSGPTKADALAALETHLESSHGMRLDRRRQAVEGEPEYMTAAFA